MRKKECVAAQRLRHLIGQVVRVSIDSIEFDGSKYIEEFKATYRTAFPLGRESVLVFVSGGEEVMVNSSKIHKIEVMAPTDGVEGEDPDF